MREPLASRIRNRLTTWFPVLLLATLAMLTYWLDAQVQRGDRANANAAADPDYYLEDFAATRYGKDGSIVQQLAAKRLTHFGNDRPTEVMAPQLITTTPGKPALRVRADRGTISADNENVWLAGNVVGERDPSPGHSKLTISTEYLHVIPRAETADTNRRVTLTDANGTHTGNALQADNKARTVHLRNGVTGVLNAHRNE
jgi:lipopolysaccharide export system protein LptC